MVSIIIPTFNRYFLLSESLKSILLQTYENFEVIVINDGSTDGTSEIAKLLNDRRIKVLNLEKQNNLARLRNIGIQNSEGNIIAFCDDDDLWESNKLEIQLNLLNDYCFVCSNAKLIDIKGNIIQKKYFKMNSSSVLDTKILLGDNVVLTPSVIFRKDILKTNKPFDENKFKNLCEDYNLWIKLSLKHNLYFLNEELISVRSHNSWARSFEHTKEIYRNHIKLVQPFLKSENKHLRKAAMLSILNNRISSLKYFASKGEYSLSINEFLKSILLFKNPSYIQTMYEKIRNLF